MGKNRIGPVYTHDLNLSGQTQWFATTQAKTKKSLCRLPAVLVFSEAVMPWKVLWVACAFTEQGRKEDSLKSRRAHFATLLGMHRAWCSPQGGLCWQVSDQSCSGEHYLCVLHPLSVLCDADVPGHVPSVPLLPFLCCWWNPGVDSVCHHCLDVKQCFIWGIWRQRW